MKLLAIFILSTFLCPNNGHAQQVITPGPTINGLQAQYFGDTGGSTSTSYYVQAVFASNQRSPIVGPATVTTPSALSSNNIVQVTWSPVPGAVSYDVLKNTTGTTPVGACNCALVVKTPAANFTDRGQSSLTYTTAAAPGISLQTAIDTATLSLAQTIGDLIVLTGTPTGAAAYTTPTATAIVGALPNCAANIVAGQLIVKNTSAGANTITMTAGSSITITGTATVAQNKMAHFLVIPTNCTTPAVTLLSINSGAAF